MKKQLQRQGQALPLPNRSYELSEGIFTFHPMTTIGSFELTVPPTETSTELTVPSQGE
jgi:hypothetical protein